MGQRGEQVDVGVRHGRPLGPELEVVHGRLRGRASDEVEPLLHVLLVNEAGRCAAPLGREEHVEVELVELALTRDARDRVGHAVGHEHHARQRRIGVVRSLPAQLGLLLVRVGPVEDLVLDELPRGERPERRAREVEVEARLNGQPGLVEGVAADLRRRVVNVVEAVVVLPGEELLRGVAPGSEVVLVEDHEVPVLEVDPLVARLDAPGLSIHPQVVLERAKAHDGPRRVALLVAVRVARDELPPVKVDVTLEVGLPRVLDRGLEGQHEHATHVHPLGELVGGKGLAKAHLGVPEELGRVVASRKLAAPEVRHGLLDGVALLGAHPKVLGATILVVAAVADLEPGVAHVIDRAAEPLSSNVLDAVGPQPPMEVMIREGRAVGAHRGLREHDLVRLSLPRLNHRELLGHAPLDVVLREADLEQARMLDIDVTIGVDLRVNVGTLREEGGVSHCWALRRLYPLSCYQLI